MANALDLCVGGGHPIMWPGTLSSFSLNAAATCYGLAFQSETDQPITQIGLNIITNTNPPTYQIALEGLDGLGRLDGVIKGSGNCKKLITPAEITAGRINWFTLDQSYTPAKGEIVTVSVKYSTGTVGASNFIALPQATLNDIGAGFGGGWSGNYAAYRATTALPGGWARVGGTYCGYKTATGVFGVPAIGPSSTTINGSEGGIKFALPIGWGSTFKLKGVRFLYTHAANRLIQAFLYQGGGLTNKTVLAQSVQLDADDIGTIKSWRDFYFTSTPTLNFGSTYRIGLVVSSGANATLHGLNFTDVSEMDALPLQRQLTLTTRTGSGDWTDTATTRLCAELILREIQP